MTPPKDHILFTVTTYPCKCGKKVQEIFWDGQRYLCAECKKGKHLTRNEKDAILATVKGSST